MAFERRILTRYDASTAGFDRGTRRVEAQLARLQRSTETRLASIDRRFERAGRAATRLGAALAGLGVSGLAVQAVRGYAEAWRVAERALTSAGFAVEGNREKLARLAIRTRSDFTNASLAVQRFARVAGGDIESNIRRVETLQKLLAIGGASGQEVRSATIQLAQGLRSGELQGEELRAIREAAPVEFLDALARRAGGTRKELKELGKQGRLTTDVILGALDELASDADQKFGALAITGSEAFEILGTGLTTFVGRADESLGVTQTLNGFMAELGATLADDAEAAETFARGLEVAAVAAVGLAGGRGLGALTNAYTQSAAARRAAVEAAHQEVLASRTALFAARARVQERREAFATAKNQEQAANSLRAANMGLTAANLRATTATNALTAAQGRLLTASTLTARAMGTLRAAFAFFGGVPGLIVASVTALALFTDTFKSQADRVKDLSDAFDDLSSDVGRLSGLQKALENDTENLEKANERLRDAINAQQDASAETARLDIENIQARIEKNRELQETIRKGAEIELQALERQVAAVRTALEKRVAEDAGIEAVGSRQGAQIVTPDGTLPFSQQRLDELQSAAVEQRRQAILATPAGELTPDDAKILTLIRQVAELDQKLSDARDRAKAFGEALDNVDDGSVAKARTAVTDAIAEIDELTSKASAERRKVVLDLEFNADPIKRAGVEAADAFDDAFKAMDLSGLFPGERGDVRARIGEMRADFVAFAEETARLQGVSEAAGQNIDRLNDSLAEYQRLTALATGETQDIIEEYGSASESVRGLIEFQRELARSEGIVASREALAALVDDFDRLEQKFGLSRQGAEAVGRALRKAAATSDFREQAAILEDIRGILEQEKLVLEDLPPEVRNFIRELGNAEAAAGGVADETGNIIANLTEATRQANALAAAFERADELSLSAVSDSARSLQDAQIRLETIGAPVERAGREAEVKFNRDLLAGAENMAPEDIDQIFRGADERRRAVVAAARGEAQADVEIAKQLEALRPRGGGGKEEKPPADILADQQARNQALLEELRIDQQLLAMRQQLVDAGVDAADADRQIEQAKDRLTAVLERNRIEQELLTRAQEEGIAVTPQLRAQITALADGYLELTLAQRQTAEAERRLQEEGQAAIDQAEARGQAIEDLGDRFSGIIREADSLSDALKNVGIELANLVAQAIAGQGPLAALFGGGGFDFGSLFNFGARASSFSNIGFAPGADVRFMHSGGLVGRDGRPGRVPAALFANAPRLHSGGIIGPDEVPAILQKGEIVVPRDGIGRTAAPNITIHQPVSVQGSGLSEDQLSRAVQAALERDRPKMLADVQKRFSVDGGYLRR